MPSQDTSTLGVNGDNQTTDKMCGQILADHPTSSVEIVQNPAPAFSRGDTYFKI